MLSPSGSHEVDVHGSLHRKRWNDGIAGNYFDVGWNTLLGLRKSYDGQAKVNVNVRGTPCHRIDLHHNVFRRSKSKSIASQVLDPANKFKRWANIFNDWAPMNDLAVGGFDGDGIDDVFVGDRLVLLVRRPSRMALPNQMPEKASALRFGDFDGDGRTDVLALHNGQINNSWAGGSPWQTVNVTAWGLSDLAVGDFDGDGRSDLFLATDTAWFVAPGARNSTAVYDAKPSERPTCVSAILRATAKRTSSPEAPVGGGCSPSILRSTSGSTYIPIFGVHRWHSRGGLYRRRQDRSG